jgi:hypothetical protein
MYSLHRLILLISIGSMAVYSGLLAGIEIILQVDTESSALVRGTKVQPPSMGIHTLRIEDTWSEIDEDGKIIIMDRDGGRLLSLRPGKKEYESTSLFALFDLRAEAYRTVLKDENYGYRSGSHGTAVLEVLVDHIFSLSDPDSDQEPDFKDTGKKRRWMSGNVRLAEWSKKGVEVSETQLDNFVFWVRQKSGGHPLILDNLLEGGVLPDETEIRVNDGRITHSTRIEVVGLRERPDLSLESRMEGFNLYTSASDGDTLVALLDWVIGASEFANSFISGGESDSAAAVEAFENGDPIRGILQLIRMEMITGVYSDSLIDKYTAQIKASRTASNLFINLNPTTRDQSEQAIQTFDVLSDAIEDQAAVLKVLMAQELTKSGRVDVAAGLYRDAILSDSGLAIAYKGLGDIFMATKSYALGWMCYDAFEIVAPNHPAMDAVRELKQSLIQDFPGLF